MRTTWIDFIPAALALCFLLGCGAEQSTPKRQLASASILNTVPACSEIENPIPYPAESWNCFEDSSK